jgi:hypothetical protein
VTHQEIDARSLALHRLVAEKIRREPSLFEIPKANITRFHAADRDDRYLTEWARLFDVGMDAALSAATEDSERAATLRQSSPFGGVLTSKERSAFLHAWSALHAAP